MAKRAVPLVALLRGVNVGGKNKIAMSALKEIVADCGYEGARTYVQSGNVVFLASVTPETAAKRLKAAIADALSITPDVIVRSRDELADVVAHNPYADRSADPTHVHVGFMPGSTKASLDGFDADRYAPEEARAIGRELFLYCPHGLGRSKLAEDLGRRKGPAGTMRNWRTVTKLLELADEVAADAAG